MASSSSSSSPTASRTGEGNGPVLYGLVPGSRSLLGVGVRAAAARLDADSLLSVVIPTFNEGEAVLAASPPL